MVRRRFRITHVRAFARKDIFRWSVAPPFMLIRRPPSNPSTRFLKQSPHHHTPHTAHRIPLILPTFPSTSSRRTAPYDEPNPEISPHSAAARPSGHLDHLATLAAHDPITNGPVSVTLLTPDSTNQDVNDIAVKLRLTVPTKWVLA